MILAIAIYHREEYQNCVCLNLKGKNYINGYCQMLCGTQTTHRSAKCRI